MLRLEKFPEVVVMPFDDENWWSRRKKRTPWDIFEEFEEYMDRLIREIERDVFSGKKKTAGPFFYGFSISIGPDGKPVFREFGNIRPTTRGPVVREEIEPLVDVYDEKDHVLVVAEIPGVNKEDIKLRATEDTLTISVEAGKRKYYKEVELPSKVNPDSAKATYKNGILEVRLEKKEKSKGKEIKVE